MSLAVRTHPDGSVEVDCTECDKSITYAASEVQGDITRALQHHAVTKHLGITQPAVAALDAEAAPAAAQEI